MKIGSPRTNTEKRGLEASWLRPDFDFFSVGACHVLASVFLDEHPDLGYRAILIAPKPPHRGAHVVAANSGWVFDANGFSQRAAYFQEFFALQRGRDPSWSAELVELDDDPAGWAFCDRYGHRHPSQLAFVTSFRLPTES